MANRTFINDGFWDRVEAAIESSGLTKKEISDQMGVERKALYCTPSAKGSTRSWHSGRIADFCRITNVSADWLLGISNRKYIKNPKGAVVQFKVIDTRTGKAPIFDGRHILKENWFRESNLTNDDVFSWCLDEDGYLVLTDYCGNVAYPPQDRFTVILI